MIDVEWLEDLRFETVNRVKVVGLLGTGTEKVVFTGLTHDGRKVAVNTRRHLLGYHIREIPPQLLRNPTYSTAKLNRKLAQLVGEPGLDEMISGWDRLFSFLTKFILEHGLDKLALLPLASPEAFLLADALPMLIYSSPIRRRLLELASLGDEGEPIVTVNTPSFPVTQMRPTLIRDASKALHLLDRGPRITHLESNPLFVWGGAAMEGFFDREREQAAVAFLEAEYGSFPGSVNAAQLIDEVDALANVFAFFFEKEEDRQAVIRFTSLCARSGLIFDVHGQDGTSIANGLTFATSD